MSQRAALAAYHPLVRIKTALLFRICYVGQLPFELCARRKEYARRLNVCRSHVLLIFPPLRTERKLENAKLVQPDAVRVFQILRHLVKKTLDDCHNIRRGQRTVLGDFLCKHVDVNLLAVLRRRVILRITLAIKRILPFFSRNTSYNVPSISKILECPQAFPGGIVPKPQRTSRLAKQGV